MISGRPTLRTAEGERELEPGEVIACPTGRAGAHRLDNRTEDLIRVLIVSTSVAVPVLTALVTLRATLKTPLTVGVPEIMPVVVSIVSPAGRLEAPYALKGGLNPVI